jgi:hypothetical protein
MFQLRNLRVLWGVVVIFLSSYAVLIPSGNFWIVQLLHSVNDMTCLTYTLRLMYESFVVETNKTHIVVCFTSG